MGKIGVRMFANISLDPDPETLIIPNALASAAYGNQTVERLDIFQCLCQFFRSFLDLLVAILRVLELQLL